MIAANPKDEGGWSCCRREARRPSPGPCGKKRRRASEAKDGLCVGVKSITVGCTFDVRGASPALGLGCPEI